MSTGARNSSLGRYGEQIAARHLLEEGMVLLERNWRCPQGELDLILREGNVLVVCEVKTRTSTAYGHPLEAVTPAKCARLRRLAAAWLSTHDVSAQEVRLDMVGVVRGARGAAIVDHVRGVG